MMNEMALRLAEPDDWPTIVDYNCRLAWETEQKRLDVPTVRSGVQAVLADPRKGRYFVALVKEQIIGQLMHTWEWSDWRNGDLWWLQSVYVAPEFRRQGVFRALYHRLLAEAESDPSVVGLRLYVEEENRFAQATYQQLGMQPAGYGVMERLFGDV